MGDCSGAVTSAGPRPARWAVVAWAAAWTIGLLAPSAVDLGDAAHPWPAALGLAIVGVLSVVAMTGADLGARRGRQWPAVAAQAVVTAALAADPGLPWGALPLLLAITVGAAVSLRWAPWLVAVIAVAATLVTRSEGDAWGAAVWGTGLTTLLAGLLTYAFGYLGFVIAELHRSRAELARSAVTAERLRFSRDLHDLLGHTLSVMVVKAQVARRSARDDPDATERHAADIEAIGREALADVRRAVQGYRRARLSDEVDGAARALRDAGIDTRVDLRHGPLTARQEDLLAWVVREATTNVVRHAPGARSASIRTTDAATGVEVRIENDGVGGASEQRRGGYGLTGLEERLRSAHGTIEVARSGEDFRLCAVVPDDGEEDR